MAPITGRSARRVALGVAAAGAAVLLQAVWIGESPVESLAPTWAPPPSRLDTIDGRLVHWRDEGPSGDSLPIVLLHGTSSSLHTWEGWIEALRADRRVIAVDLPGFALTDPFPDGDYAAERYVAFVRRFLDHLGIPRAVVGGNSLGGQVAWMLAVADPARVAGLVLVDPAGYPMVSTSVPLGFRLARIPVVNLLLQRITPRGVVASSVRNVYGDPSRVTEALVDRYFQLLTRRGNRAALVDRMRRRTAEVDTSAIATIRVPTLILWGGRDGLIPPDHGDRFARDITGSRLTVFPALGHVPHEEDPATTVAEVGAFLRGLGVSGGGDDP